MVRNYIFPGWLVPVRCERKNGIPTRTTSLFDLRDAFIGALISGVFLIISFVTEILILHPNHPCNLLITGKGTIVILYWNSGILLMYGYIIGAARSSVELLVLRWHSTGECWTGECGRMGSGMTGNLAYTEGSSPAPPTTVYVHA
jgi:hypothetical protein